MQHLGTVALFGGAYNNWLAVDAVVEDAKRRGAEAVWFLGDAGGFGPHPDRTVERLVHHQIASIQGNYDESVGNGLEDCGCGYTDPRDNHYAQISYDYTLANTSGASRRWLAALPAHGQIRVGEQSVLLCHGSPRKVNEFLWESTTPANFIEAQCDQAGVDLIACTHTGLHWERRLSDGRGLVNVGAVGRPANDGRTCVWYTLLQWRDGRVQTTFVPVEFDRVRLTNAMRDEGLPDAFIETIHTGYWTTCLEIMPSMERRRGIH